MLLLSLSFFLLSFLISNVKCENEKITSVTLSNGEIIGENRGYYHAFEGIPYAAPPVGERRFEDPQPYVQIWTQPWNATVPGASCIQYDHFVFQPDKVHGSEDCLFLNIYTKNTNPKEKYPVIFFIHGGAFSFGHGDFYGPQALLHRDVILVTINYRLGPLGFISTLDSQLPGNMGLKDQNLALKWVNENIERFGGDANKITLSGYSAGASSVHLHYMSPKSRGLFQNGISHSGTALNLWAMSKKPIEKAKQLALLLDCPICCTKKLKKCLKTKSAEEIVGAVAEFHVWLYNPFSVFGPVVEEPSESAFITKSPLQYIQSGEISPNPWVASFCEDEGIYPAGEFVRSPSYLTELDSNWLEYAPLILHYNDSIPADKLNDVSQKIRKHYLQEQLLNEENFPQLINLISDGLFKVRIQQTIELQSQTTTSPIYFYYYQYPASFGIEELLSFQLKNWGVSHGDDVLTIYENVIRRAPKGLPYEERELLMQKELIDFYETLLSNKVPIFGGTELKPVTITEDGFNFIDILSPTEHPVKRVKDLSNVNFWDDLIPIV